MRLSVRLDGARIGGCSSRLFSLGILRSGRVLLGLTIVSPVQGLGRWSARSRIARGQLNGFRLRWILFCRSSWVQRFSAPPFPPRASLADHLPQAHIPDHSHNPANHDQNREIPKCSVTHPGTSTANDKDSGQLVFDGLVGKLGSSQCEHCGAGVVSYLYSCEGNDTNSGCIQARQEGVRYAWKNFVDPLHAQR